MTDAERMILRGLDLLIRTQFFPGGGDPASPATAAHFRKLSADYREWGEDYDALTDGRPKS